MDTVTRERYLRQLNYEKRMKLKEEVKKAFQKAEEKAFKMIPDRPTPFEIRTEDVNYDKEDYVILDNYVNFLTSDEIASNEVENSPTNKIYNSKGKKSTKSGTEVQAAISEKAILMNILPPDNVYDGDRDVNIEHKVKDKVTLRNKPLTHGSNFTDKDQDKNTYLMPLNKIAAPKIHQRVQETGINISVISTGNQSSIGNQPGLPENSNLEVKRCQFKCQLKVIGVCVAVMMTVVGLCVLVYYFTPINTDNSRVNATHTHDAKCFNFRENCTSLLEKKITADILASGNITQVCDIIRCGASVNSYYDKHGSTPLYFAANTGNMDLTRLLLVHNASVDQVRNSNGETPLFAAAHRGHVNVMRLLLAYNASVHSVASFGRTLLYATTRHADAAQLLLTYKIRVDKAREGGRTPLFMASLGENNADVVKLLLRYNASVNRNDVLGDTPLSSASAYNNLNVIKILLANNASVDKANFHGETPLYKAARYGHVGVVEILLTYHASVDKADSDGCTPLYKATWYGHLNVVQTLLTKNAAVNKANKYGWAPLHAAMWSRDKDKDRFAIVKALYYARAHINAQSTKVYNGFAAGSTALHIVVRRSRNKSLVEKLMVYTTKFFKSNNDLKALDMFRKYKYMQVTE